MKGKIRVYARARPLSRTELDRVMLTYLFLEKRRWMISDLTLKFEFLHRHSVLHFVTWLYVQKSSGKNKKKFVMTRNLTKSILREIQQHLSR